MDKLRKYMSWSYLAILVCCIVFATQIFSLKFYKENNRIIVSDVSNYYAYLPLTFIFDQMDYRLDEKSFPILKDYIYSVPVGNGNFINPYTMGMAMAYSPFFFAVHLPVKWMGYPTTGFTQPYRVSIILACLFYTLAALFMLRKILLRTFDESVTAFTMLTLVLATNLLYYITYDPGMPHAFNFAFFTGFLFLTIRWHENPGVFSSTGIGLLTGMISLIRPTDALIALVFIFWKVYSFTSLKENILLFLKKWHLILIIVFFAFMVWIPQMLYWKNYTGHFLYNPYGDVGFRFFFENPQIYLSLFSYRKGWLIYTPFMLMLIPGFIYLYRKYRIFFWPVVIFFLVNLWIISSWCLPWYGGGYGQRAYIASYAILSLPLAAAFSLLLSKKRITGLVAASLISGIFIAHNLFQLRQYHRGAIHYVSMTKEAYWDSFLRTNPSPRFQYLLSFPDYERAKKGEYPVPEIDPIYTGKLTKEEILDRVHSKMLAGLNGDSLKFKALQDQARAVNVSYEVFVRNLAETQVEQQIMEGIIVPKK